MRAEYTQGQGRASGFVQIEGRDLRTGAKRVERLRPSETVERVQLDRADYTFLYDEGKKLILMHPDTFEQARRGVAHMTCGCTLCSLPALTPRASA